ncbi:MAG: ScpA family protein [Sphingopyxis sp.]
MLDELAFDDAPPASPPTSGDALRLDIDGWEGPLDLLLALARVQKVDLKAISILELVEQYLGFIDRAHGLSLEIAADYLVMAAWLTLLKSALLLPQDHLADPSPDELAMRLQLRLERLAAMRDGGARIVARDRVGRDVFLRGRAEGLRVIRRRAFDVGLFELIQAYGEVQARTQPAMHVVDRREVMTLDAAIARLESMIGAAIDWRDLATFLPAEYSGDLRKSALASSFVAALELARTGKLSLMQDVAFTPLYVRKAG